jgi:anti-sigma B factor antagonist
MTDPVIVVLSGEIDLLVREETAAAMTEAAENALAGCCDIVVDLAGVSFIDSSGLRILVEAHQARSGDDASLTLRSPSAAVQRLLEISGLTGHLDVTG